jgi:hypothetical protein
MRKILTAALAALTFGGAVAASTAPAEAQAYHRWGGGGWHGGGYRYYGHGHSDAGVAVAAGVVGLALGAAIASDHGGGRYYGRGYYGGGYYDYPGYYGYYREGYRVCESSHWAWDPYAGRHILVTDRYAC